MKMFNGKKDYGKQEESKDACKEKSKDASIEPQPKKDQIDTDVLKVGR